MKEINLIPRPLKQQTLEGVFESSGVPEISGDSFFSEELSVFSAQMSARYNLTAESQPRIFCIKLEEKAIPPEGYRLKISPQKIEIAAACKAGMYNGLQSLRQLFLSGDTGDVFIRSPETHFVIPCAEIEDAPAYPWRGFMLDCSRYFYHVNSIKKIIDVLSMHHINVFHWHLTDDQGWRLPVPEYPKLAEIGSQRRNPNRQEEIYTGGFYSEDDISEIIAFAAARHVTVVPEVDIPGHTVSALAAYPEFGCTGGPYQVEWRFGVHDDILCAGNDKIFDFVGAVFDTLARLFPGKYVHIGGDEAPTTRWENCPHCKERMAELGLTEPRQLQRWLTRRFAGMLAERGKIAIGWDEVLEGTDITGSAAQHTALPQDLIVMAWRSWMNKQLVLDAAAQGRNLIITPSNHGGYISRCQSLDPDDPGKGDEPSTLRDSYLIPLVQPEMTSEQAKLVLGGQGNLWGEQINSCRNAEYMIFPRICALAEAFWTAENLRDYEDFLHRLPIHQRRIDAFGILQFRGWRQNP